MHFIFFHEKQKKSAVQEQHIYVFGKTYLMEGDIKGTWAMCPSDIAYLQNSLTTPIASAWSEEK